MAKVKWTGTETQNVAGAGAFPPNESVEVNDEQLQAVKGVGDDRFEIEGEAKAAEPKKEKKKEG